MKILWILWMCLVAFFAMIDLKKANDCADKKNFVGVLWYGGWFFLGASVVYKAYLHL